PPSWDEMVDRLVSRGTESSADVSRRLATAKQELAAQREFDEVIVNADLQRTVKQLLTLILGDAPDTGATSTIPAQERCE
ncbi:MAG: guanylate kinase, partial [Actinophytocola sp.]|nr:guanylate kinase [Actinophytocola sp.]